MKTIFQKDTCQLLGIFLLWVLLIISFSCKKDMNTTGIPTTPEVPGVLPDLQTKINSSVSGFVTDQNDAPVVGAEVKAGATAVSTDNYGYFEIINVQVVKEAATVTVIYPGYFKGIKTYRATEGKAAFFRIKLLHKTIAGTIDANTGGDVFLNNGISISIPANAIKDASGGTNYNGEVKVSAQYIDPTSDELINTMPGDLRGINTEGAIRGLTSFGMIAVELMGDAGQLLQVADGKKSTLTMHIPTSIAANAPSTIPLWYFDEDNGLWKEEGTATRIGNSYIGDVSHFSFWNCDAPSRIVQFSCTLLNGAGLPLGFVPVKISFAGSQNNVSWGYTDPSGYVGGGIPENTQFQLDVYNNSSCGTAVYSQHFSTQTSDISLGNLEINASNRTAEIAGSVTKCGNIPVTEGVILMKVGSRYSSQPLNNSGTYNFAVLLCEDSTVVSFKATDASTGIESQYTNYTLRPGSNSIANIPLCGGVAASGSCISNGFFYHPNPLNSRAIVNLHKTAYHLAANEIKISWGDMGPSGYEARLTVDSANNITVNTFITSYTQFNTALPSTLPGYIPQWPGSSQCNNTYDPVQKEYRVRYGFFVNSAGANYGWHIAEEIIKVL